MSPDNISSIVAIGDTLARRYRVERILGAGGMGVVVAGRHLELNQERAIKLMTPRALEDSDAVERFIREAKAAVKLRSEHIAAVHDFGRLDSGAPFIVMELLKGEDLAAMLKRRGPLPIDDCILYVSQACHALAEAHAAHIVHRDLKPANLFLTHRTDGSPCVKVLDFGISKDLSANVNSPEPEITKTNAFMGTLHYMAPEQMRSARKVDARADVWALGAIMYKLLTGRAPFQAPVDPEIIFATLDATPVRPPSLLRADIPPALEEVILCCLEKDAAKRYSSAAEVIVALRPFGPCPAKTGDDEEKTLYLPPPAMPAPTQETMQLEWQDIVEIVPDNGSVTPSSGTTLDAPSPRPSILNGFPAEFYFRPPPVTGYVVRPRVSHPSIPSFHLLSHPGSPETLAPMEMPAVWQNIPGMRSAIGRYAAVGTVARRQTLGTVIRSGIPRLAAMTRKHARVLMGMGVAIWLALIVIIVARGRAPLATSHAPIAVRENVATNAPTLLNDPPAQSPERPPERSPSPAPPTTATPQPTPSVAPPVPSQTAIAPQPTASIKQGSATPRKQSDPNTSKIGKVPPIDIFERIRRSRNH